MLADDVRTGKVGGVCSVNMASVGSSHSSGTSERGEADGGALLPCELCGILALVLPSFPVLGIPSFAGTRVSRVFLPVSLAASIPGLPFSRGPPAL